MLVHAPNGGQRAIPVQWIHQDVPGLWHNDARDQEKGASHRFQPSVPHLTGNLAFAFPVRGERIQIECFKGYRVWKVDLEELVRAREILHIDFIVYEDL